MNMRSAKLVFFSPTGTTKSVLQAIAAGIGVPQVEMIDITRPDARKKPLRTSEDELLIIGIPVYMGRAPAVLNEYLNAIQARDTPTVCVVVYGNRAYEDALLELKNIVTGRGCVPIAGAAYIGEHSFSNADTPVAPGRPDADDLKHAREFGRKVREKLESVSRISQALSIQVPGAYPYEKDTKLWDVDFIAVSDACIQCGLCAEVCPMDAVDPEDSSAIDVEKCITCCACIKSCPQDARSKKPGPVMDAAVRLNSLYQEPKQPEYFL